MLTAVGRDARRAARLLLVAAAITLSLVHSQSTVAATRTWTGLGVTNNWNDAANWSGGLIPGAGDVASFDGTSSKNAIMNVAVNVGGVSIAGYGGTITQAAGIAATVGATGWTQAGGTFVGGTAAFTVNGPYQLTSGSYTTTGGTMSVTGAFTVSGGTFSAPAGTVSFSGAAATLTVSTPDTFNNVTFASTKSIAAGTTMTVTGSLSLSSGNLNGTGTLAAQGPISQASTFTGGTATLLINGTANQTLTGTATLTNGGLPPLVINKPSGTLTLTGTIRTANNWTYTAGTLDASAATLVFAGGTISGSHTLGTVHFRATTTLAAGTVLTVSGPLTLTAGSLNGPGSLTALGDINQALGYGGGTAVLLIGGTVDQTLNGASTTASGSLPQIVINKPSGTLFLTGTIRTTSNWTYTAGTLDSSAATMVFAGGTITGSHSLATVDVRATTSIAAGTTLTVTGSLSLSSGNLNGTGTLAAQGPISQASTFTGGTATLLINGTANQTLTGTATLTNGGLPPLVINKPSGTLTLTGTIRTANNWTYTAGTLDASAATLVFAGGTISGSHTLGTVHFRATTTLAAGTVLTVSGPLTLTAGSLNGPGSLTALGDINQALGYGGGTAVLLIGGTVDQTLNGASTTASGSLPQIVINKPSGTLFLTGTIRTTSNWTYTAGTLDSSAATMVFAGGTITGSHSLATVDVRATTSIAAGTTMTVTGSLSLSSGNLNGTGTLAAQGPISQASTFTGGTATLLINGTANQTLTGTATLTNGGLPPLVINKPSGTLTLTGTIRTANNWTYTAGTLDASAATLVFAGGTISGSHTLGTVHFRATTTLAAGTVLTVSGPLTLTAGSLNGPGSLTALGDINQALGYGGGTAVLLIGGTVDQTLNGASTTASGSLPQIVINKPSGTLFLTGTIRTTSNWTYTAGTLDAGTSLVVFGGGTVTSAGMSFYDVTTVTGTTTLGSAMVITHDLTVASGIFTTSASFHALTVGGNLTVAGTFRENGSAVSVGGNVTNNGTITPATSTLTLNGSAGQSIGGSATMPAFNLVINDAAGVTLTTDLTVTGTLTLTSGQLSLGASRLTISNAIAGTPTNLVGGASAALTVTGMGAGITVPSSVVLLRALTLSNANGLALQADLTIGGTLTLTSGRLDAGVNTVIVGSGGVVVRTAGWVVGRLQKPVAAGSAVAVVFEIGDATRYTPAAVTFGTVTTPGALTASTTAGDHPDIANSGLAVAQSVNRYWTIANSGVAFDTYDATFTFVAADVDLGADPTIFIVAKLDGTTWTRPATGARTALSTQAVGMTSFSDFAVGEPTADLGVAVSDGLASVVAGDGLGHGYTITVSNGGPSDATAVSLAAVWPTGFSQGLVSPSQGSCAPTGGGPDFGCDLGTIAAGASATVSVAYTVPAGTPGGDQTITVSVGSAVVDPVPADDSASDTTTVVESAVLVVAKDDGLATVVAGTSGHVYTISVTNGGPSDADTVSVADVVPAALTAGSPSADLGGDCSGSIGNTIACDLPASLAPGATWTITLPYTVGSDVPAQMVSNTAIATSDENPAGVAALDGTDVTTSADLGVAVSDGLASVVAGDGLGHGYTITVSNGGPSDATAASLAAVWPTGFSQGLVSPSQGSCAPTGGGPDFGCDLGTIAAGASATVSVAYTVPAGTPGGDQTITVSVGSAVVDPVPADDSASDTTTVVESAVLVVAKDDGLATVVAGTSGHVYTISVTNGGPSDADTVSVADVVPAALTAGSPSADLGGDCSGSIGNTIACDLPASLAPGATWTITLPYTVGSDVPAQMVSNTATATSDENPAGVAALDGTDVTTSADLGVAVSDGLASVVAGDGLGHGYTITVSNGGPSDATAASLAAVWPTGFSQGLVSPSQGRLRADRRRARLRLRPGHHRGRRERHGQRRLHRPGRHPRRRPDDHRQRRQRGRRPGPRRRQCQRHDDRGDPAADSGTDPDPDPASDTDPDAGDHADPHACSDPGARSRPVSVRFSGRGRRAGHGHRGRRPGRPRQTRSGSGHPRGIDPAGDPHLHARSDSHRRRPSASVTKTPRSSVHRGRKRIPQRVLESAGRSPRPTLRRGSRPRARGRQRRTVIRQPAGPKRRAKLRIRPEARRSRVSFTSRPDRSNVRQTPTCLPRSARLAVMAQMLVTRSPRPATTLQGRSRQPAARFDGPVRADRRCARSGTCSASLRPNWRPSSLMSWMGRRSLPRSAPSASATSRPACPRATRGSPAPSPRRSTTSSS